MKDLFPDEMTESEIAASKWKSLPVDPREAAQDWIAETITKHLRPELGGADRIRQVAASIEDEAHEQNMPIELAVSLAVEWCEIQNDEAGLAHASHN